jgi:serine protease Do
MGWPVIKLREAKMHIKGFGEVVEKLRRSTVQIRAGHRGQGSGLVVNPEGIIVTNAHVAVFSPLEVDFWDGNRIRADLQVRDVNRDLAILHVPGSGLPAASLADSDSLRIGEPVIAIGNPLGFIGALTTGVIRGIGRIAGLGSQRWIQSDVRLAPGNSGGPLASALGVVGINTMVAGQIGLAVPSNSVSRLLERGTSRATLGVTIRPVWITAIGNERLGLLIVEIAKNGAASIASLMRGDILIGVDGKYFHAIEDFENLLQCTGECLVRLNFLRGDRSHLRTVSVRLGIGSAAA